MTLQLEGEQVDGRLEVGLLRINKEPHACLQKSIHTLVSLQKQLTR